MQNSFFLINPRVSKYQAATSYKVGDMYVKKYLKFWKNILQCTHTLSLPLPMHIYYFMAVKYIGAKFLSIYQDEEKVLLHPSFEFSEFFSTVVVFKSPSVHLASPQLLSLTVVRLRVRLSGVIAAITYLFVIKMLSSWHRSILPLET